MSAVVATSLAPETYLPRDGSDVGPGDVSLVQPFIDAGLVQLEPYAVVYCADVEDDAADRDPWCDAFVEPHGSDELECAECGHVFWHEPSHVRRRFRARVERSTIEGWLHARLGHEGEVERLRGGCAWRVSVGEDEFVMAVLDWSEDSKWVDAGRMDVDPTVLVLVESHRYRTALRPGVVAVDLEALVLGLELGPTWDAVRATSIRFERPRAWLPSHTLPNRYHCRWLGAHLLEALDGDLSLDGVRIGARGYAPVRELIRLHAEDVADAKSSENHCWWSARELGDSISMDRDAVKKGIARFLEDVCETFTQATGRPLSRADVIESSRRGYRLNPDIYGRLA